MTPQPFSPLQSERQDPVGVALIGLGRWGTKLAHRLALLPGCQLVSVCDTDARRLRDARVPANAVRCRRLEDALTNPKVEACVIATPATLHADQSLKAINAGKHVFVEKPMALSAKAAHAISAAASRTGLQVMVGHILHYDPVIAQLRSLVASGDIGTLLGIEADRFNTSDTSAAEGVWWNLAPHDVSLVLELVGEEVSALTARSIPLKGCRSEAVEANLAFPSGIVATVRVACAHRERVRSLRITGTRATVLYTEQAGGKQISTSTDLRSTDSDPPPILGTLDPASSAPAEDTLTLELRHFVDSIRLGTPPTTDHRQGARVVEILERAHLQYAAEHAHRNTNPWSLRFGN